MKPSCRMTVCLVLWTFIEVSSNRTVEEILVKSAIAIGSRCLTRCTVLLHPYDSKYLPPKLFKMIKFMTMLAASGHGMVLTKNIHVFGKSMEIINKSTAQNRCSRSIHVLLGEENLYRAPFIEVTHQIQMAGTVWVVYLRPDTNAVTFLEGINAPFDVEMIVARVQTNGTVTLEEVYRASHEKPLRILYYGFWSESDELISPVHISLYHRRSNLEGTVLKVGHLTHAKNKESFLNEYLRQIWETLELRLNFTSNCNIPNDSNKSTFEYILTMIKDEEVTVGVSYFTMTSERYNIVDFLRPLIFSRNQLFFKESGSAIHWNSILLPFTLSIWFLIVGWIILASIFLSIFIYTGRKRNLEDLHVCDEFTIKNSIFIVLQAFLQQSHSVVPSSLACRILFISSYLTAWVLLTAYSASLISYITIQTPKSPFKSLHDLIEEGSYSLIAVNGSASYTFFANATDEEIVQAFNRLMKNKVMPKSSLEGLKQVCSDPRIVFFGSYMAAVEHQRDLNAQGCNIRVLEKPLNTLIQSIAIGKRSQYTGALNHHLDALRYQGILARITKNASSVSLESTKDNSFTSVGFEQVLVVFTIFCTGISLSIIFLFCENRIGGGVIGGALNKNIC